MAMVDHLAIGNIEIYDELPQITQAQAISVYEELLDQRPRTPKPLAAHIAIRYAMVEMPRIDGDDGCLYYHFHA